MSLTLKTKLSYGMGELGTVIPISIAVFFLLFFLTDVAGLSPTLAGAVLLWGRVWDAVNDPLIGWLSDQTRSRWGRRYPWMLYGAVPLALCCALQWIVPPLQSQIGLFLYYSGVSLVAYAAFSAVLLPFAALAAELTPDYDERTELMGIKAGFNITGSMLGLVMAQGVFALVQDGRQQYVILGGVSSLTVVIGLGICIWGTQGQYWAAQSGFSPQAQSRPLPPWAQLSSLLMNRSFLWVMGLYLCSWMGLQVTAAMLPYFVVHWMGLPEQHFTQMAIVVQGAAVLAMPVWIGVVRKTSKKMAYLVGAPLTLTALLALSGIQPGQVGWMYGLAVVIGLGLATFYLVPLAMLPDVIDEDALRTGQRREGLYFSCLVFLQKVGLAIALFMVGGWLDWAGFQATTDPGMAQPLSALWAIRLLIGVFPAGLILAGLYCAGRYPLSRCHHQNIHNRLDS
jgi:GPH family glycoside/pentoside/hexuronide:cation symporter